MRQTITSEFDMLPARGGEAVAPPRQLARIAGACGWALAGFVVGAVFWHLVGFWSFLSAVVLKGPEQRPRLERYVLVDETTAVTRRATPVPAADGEQAAPGVASAAGCSALARDGHAGATRLLPCAIPHTVTWPSGDGAKTDRERPADESNLADALATNSASPAAWSATVASPSPAKSVTGR